MKRVMILCALLSLTIGCGRQETTPEEPTFELVQIHTNSDGTQAISRGKITLSQEIAMNEARRRYVQAVTSGNQEEIGKLQQAISEDSGCSASSLWVNSDVDQLGDRICYTGGSGSIYLPNSWRQSQGSTRYPNSYWAGTQAGYFCSFYLGDVCTNEYFSAWQKTDNAGFYAEQADLIVYN